MSTRTTGSDHFDGRRFFNPTGANGRSTLEVPRMLMARRTRWPARVPVDPRRPAALDGAAAVVSFIGHATLLMQTAAGHILTDPMFSDTASPLSFAGPRRTRAPGIRFDDLPAIAVVLLSHNHYDHCDLPTLRAIERRWSPLVVTPLGNARLLRAAGVRRIEELDWWQASTQTPFPVTVTPAQHFSARTPFDRNRALWGGFMIGAGAAGRRIFFAADTGYGPHFTQIRERLGSPDLALLPIGAYEPRWFMKDIHMNPAEAVQAHVDLRATRSIGIHFGTFQLTAEGLDDPAMALAAALRAQQVPQDQFRVPEFGESFTLA
jgi:L-ascorbate metabolism protein UlaG (beta-lactamase superfamily)